MIFHNLAIFVGDSYRIQTCNLLIRSQVLYSVELRSRGSLPGENFFLLSLGLDLHLLDASLLTGKVAEVVDAGAADFTDLVDLDAVDEGGLEGEDPLDADATGNLADGERLGERVGAFDLDHDASELLEPFLVSFFDLVGHGDGVTCLELGEAGYFVVRKCLLCNLYQIHN